jgi:NHL repeat
MKLHRVIVAGILLAAVAVHAARSEAPQFRFDAAWPRQLPNGWTMGMVAGVRVDASDHIWIVQRPVKAAAGQPQADSVRPAPPVIEFDQAGTVVRAWGGPGPGYDWPPSSPIGTDMTGEHGIFVDSRNAVWIGTIGPEARQILKFSRDGKFLLQIGSRGAEKTRSDDVKNLGEPTGFAAMPSKDRRGSDEVFVSDGHTNRRIIVFDALTGGYKRQWGAYGRLVGSASRNGDTRTALASTFDTPHAIAISTDGLVYVADRNNNRIQVFKADGSFVAEGLVSSETHVANNGTVSDIGFSPDAGQRFLYVPDGLNAKVWILRRSDLAVVGSFGRPGDDVGSLGHITTLAVDSKGNIYVDGRSGMRIQRFTPTR